MMRHKNYVSVALLFVATVAYAVAPSAPTKTYTLTDLHHVVANSKSCKPLYKALKKAAKEPFVLQFSAPTANSSLAVTEKNKQITSHDYSILKQDVSDGVVHRIGTGSFMLNLQKVDYVIDVSADTSNPHFQYLYPIILVSDNAHCYYTGMIRPDATTVNDFKKNIAAGNVAKKTDLYTKP